MKFPKINTSHRGFTIFEIIISITIFALIMISVFDSVANIGFARIKSTQRISLIEELYFFSEKLTTLIKEGGMIDYEEYWGRMAVGTGIVNGHYQIATLFGNYGSGSIASTGGTNNYGESFYYCRSSSSFMGTGGCISSSLYNTSTASHVGKAQRYGEYHIQFTDYNGNLDINDTPYGDEDGDGKILGDDDDIELGNGPEVIQNPMKELYLINALDKKRVFLRVNYKIDPNAPGGAICNTTTGAGSGCLGNVQILKLDGKDIGIAHDGTGSTAFDGNIDTWVCDADWRCVGKTLGTYGTLSFNNDADWVDLFPDYINIKNLQFYIYPLKNPWYSWKSPDNLSSTSFVSPFIHPYVRIELSLGFAWKRRSIIANDDPTINISTTISLQDYANE